MLYQPHLAFLMTIPFLPSFPRRIVVFNPTGRYAAAQVAAIREAGMPPLGSARTTRDPAAAIALLKDLAP